MYFNTIHYRYYNFNTYIKRKETVNRGYVIMVKPLLRFSRKHSLITLINTIQREKINYLRNTLHLINTK